MDVTKGQAEPVPSVIVDVQGATTVLFTPAGRMLEVVA
jgi:hypothetical protein